MNSSPSKSARTTASPKSASHLHIPVEHTTLANGLRVVVSPDHSAPVVTVGVYYQIGFRLEPRGRSGFAHLFEHMMFQGSENAGKMEHIKLINSSGGLLNGTTNYDVTNYFESVPSNALERVLWLEADRMRALKVDDENLRNQRDVVKEEVRVNVLNQPYGGFAWLDLPPVAFRNWPNAHNFYGDFADLDAATLADVQQFFRTYYAPNNAVLLMLGDLDPAEAFALAKRYFEDIPPGAPPPRADVTELPQTEERHGEVQERLGPLPAIAIGYTMPPRESEDWFAAGLIDRILHGGRAGRVYRKLVLEEQIAVDIDGGADLIESNGPTQMVTRIYHKPEFTSEGTVAVFDEIIEDLQRNPVTLEELDPVKVKFRSDFYSMLETGMGSHMPRFGLMHFLACFTLFDGDPHRINTILDGFLAVTPAHVQAAARRYLVPQNRAVLFRKPVNLPAPANSLVGKGGAR
ncbi:MAG TPA: pitrilysin family protein [Candidatus Aquilonibacter sp.]|nr:pitrilysin family protein [Candidatus Aquilonibacter sp.]